MYTMDDLKQWGMKRYHLLHYKNEDDYWYVYDVLARGVGAGNGDKLNIDHCTDVVQSNTLEDLLLTLRNGDDADNWYGVIGWIDDKGKTRAEIYPHFHEVHRLIGWVPEVCTPKLIKMNYETRKYEFQFISELWNRNKNTIRKVICYSELMEEHIKGMMMNGISSMEAQVL